MAGNRDEANVSGNPAPQVNPAKETQDEKPEAVYQANRAKGEPEVKNQPDDGYDPKENAGRPPHNNSQPEGSSPASIRDVIGGDVDLRQGTQNIFISYGGFESFDSILEKFPKVPTKTQGCIREGNATAEVESNRR